MGQAQGGAAPRLALTVFAVSENLRDPIDGDPRALFHGERVVGGLKFDVRPYPVVAQMRACFQIFRARIKGQFGREPSEEWADVRSFRRIETSHELIETVLAERNPDAPGEWLCFPMHRNLQATQNKEILPVDHAGIAVEHTSIVTRLDGNRIIEQRRVRTEGGHSLVPFLATRAFEPHLRPI